MAAQGGATIELDFDDPTLRKSYVYIMEVASDEETMVLYVGHTQKHPKARFKDHLTNEKSSKQLTPYRDHDRAWKLRTDLMDRICANPYPSRKMAREAELRVGAWLREQGHEVLGDV